MSTTTIESLELQVQSSATSATNGIDTLTASLSKLKNAVKGGIGLNTVARQVSNLNTALKSVDGSSADKIDRLTNSLSRLASLSSLKISSSIGNQLKNIGTAATSLNGTDFSGIQKMDTALQPLSNISNATGLKSTITQLQKLPQLAQTLNGINWATLTSQLSQLSSSLAPLANQLNTVSNAFNRLPTNIRQVVTVTNRITQANNRAANSYVNLWAKLTMAITAVKTGARVLASWITESNSYIENLNLFTASMGKYAAEAQKYAEQVGDLMGIDPGEWMRNQGVFMTITEGFGVASDRAYIMSKNLTQLGYDLSSFFNIPFADAMQKLQSGISGELEPLRRLGYDLSQARLEQERLNLGIDKSVTKMTQAEKAQLRYYAIMTQVKLAQGDMARTLEAPANQLRILKAQVTQCARALGNIFIPILNAVLPYVIAFAKVLRMIADGIASIAGFKLPEVDYSGLDKSFGNLSDSTGDISDALKDATKKAEKFKRSIMGFDELNLLNDNSKSLSDALDGLNGLGGDLGFELPEYDFIGDLVNSKVDKIVEMIRGALSEITAVISGFLLAIGTILVVTGANIPLGLGLMAIGAIGLAATIAENWNCMTDRLARTLTTITAVLGGFLLAIGAFLVFSGVNVPLGAGLMVAGAISLATAATINWKFLNGNMTNALSILTGIVSGALLAMGALFAFTGVSVPLGIALMAAGAIGLATAIGLNWNAMTDPMRAVIGTLEAIVGGALLTFGAILALTGVNVPLGIAMIAAGAIAIVSAVALNWGALTGSVQGSLATITAIVSGALIGVGAILALTGVATALGITMIAAGAVGIIATAPLNWGALTGQIKTVLKEIGIAVGAALLALGAVLALSGVALPLGIALMAAGAVSLVSGVALNWDFIIGKIKDTLKQIGIIAGAALLALGVILCVTGVGIPLGIALIAAGAVSLVSGVALNWNAVKGYISSFFATVARLFVGVSLVALGLILCASGVGLPLGVGLIAAGASAITKPQSFNVQNLVKIGSDAIGGLKKGVSDAWKGFCSFWEGLFKGALDWVKNFFGIHSPSTVFANLGLNMVAGLQNGFKNIGSVFNSVFKTVGGWLGDFGKNMYSWGSEMMGNLVTGINSGLSNLANHVANVARTIWSYLHFSEPEVGALADFNSWMPDMMSQLASGIADNEDMVKKQISKLASDMSLESTVQANVSAYGASPAANTVGENNSGLVNAVYTAVSSALTAQSDNTENGTPIVINLGNEQIASFLVKQNKRVALISGGKA